MGFDDVAQRMKGRQKPSRIETLWHGEEPAPPPLPVPVEPARRTGTMVAAYAVLTLGIAVIIAAGVVLLLWFSTIGRWERRGLFAAIAVGIGCIVHAIRLFEAVEQTEPLPRADLR